MEEKSQLISFCEVFPRLPAGTFASHMACGPGLSLSYEGLSNGEVMERLEVVNDETYTSASGNQVRRVSVVDRRYDLSVELEYTVYAKFDAVLYGATIKNEGTSTIQHLTALHSYDLVFAPLQGIGNPTIHTVGGGLTHWLYPPLAYRLQAHLMFGPTELTLDSGPSGRSSNKDLPFFVVEDGACSSGIFGGIEWSGLWRITFSRKDEPQPSHIGRLGPEKSLRITGGMDGADLLLQAGETFSMPRMLLGFYQGSVHDGRNRLRGFIGDWAPNLSGTSAPLLVQGCPDGCYSKYQISDEVCRKNAAAMAELGAEYYMLANWFQDKAERTRAYSATTAARGSWIADPIRWPELKSFADYVRSLGMIFGLWTDIEVACNESAVATEHPDWVLYSQGDPDGLLNFALPQVQEWAIETYDRLIKELGVKWFFLDNNINPRPFWDLHETATRRGRLQHDYIRGVWRVWEWLLDNHPEVGLENCSSGGRRVDLGTLGRTHRSQSSDQFRHPDSIRYQSSGFNTAIPGDRMSTYMCCGLSPYPDVAFQANFGGMLAMSEDFENWSDIELARAKRHVEVYKSIRHLLGKDFYPLFPQPSSLSDWDGWQYQDPRTGEGFALVFRAQSQQETTAPCLHGLDERQAYVLTNPYTGEQRELTGEYLMGTGLSMGLAREGTCLYTFRPKWPSR